MASSDPPRRFVRSPGRTNSFQASHAVCATLTVTGFVHRRTRSCERFANCRILRVWLTRRGANPFGQWFAGVGLATLLAGYAVRCLVTGHAMFFSGRPIRLVEFHGPSATAIGVLSLCIAAFMHMQLVLDGQPSILGLCAAG